MGQYYRIVVGEKDGMGFHVYDASKYIGENGEKGFDGGKLLEHSWTSSCAPQSVFRLLRMKPHRVAWVGDYAQDLLKGGMLLGTSSRVIEKGVRVPSHVEVWGNSEPELLIMENALPLDGQFLLNMEAKEFVERTGVTSLTVAIGTAHGFYVGTPVLDKERLSEIREVVDIPLVLHGASGLSDEDVMDCVKRGICKVNFATELRAAYSKAVKELLAEKPDTIDPKAYGKTAIAAVKELVMARMKVCGCDGKAE